MPGRPRATVSILYLICVPLAAMFAGGTPGHGQRPDAAAPGRIQTNVPARPGPHEGRIVDRESEPWLGPTGEQLVGVVNDRFMTRRELNRKAEQMLQQMPPLPENMRQQERDIMRQDRRIQAEDVILHEWVMITTLALHARNEGFSVSEAEVDRALNKMVQHQGVRPTEAFQTIRLRGIPESEIRAEIRRGILVEKLIHTFIEHRFSELDLRRIFETYPRVFLKPSRVRAWQLFYPKPTRGWITNNQRRQRLDRMYDWRKRLRRCDQPEDYQQLKEELEQREDAVYLRDMGWTEQTEPLPKPLLEALFTTDPDETSEVAHSSLGMHVVKVLKREEGHRGTFEEARPQVVNYLFEKLKPILYEDVRRFYRIYKDAAGLKKWRRVRPTGSAVAAGSAQSPSPSPTPTPRPTPGGFSVQVPSVMDVLIDQGGNPSP